MCSRALSETTRGRPRLYCCHACRQVAYRQRQGAARRHRLVQLVQADARDFLAALPEESVDLIVTDPPYRFDRGATYFREWFAELDDGAWPEIFRDLYRVLRGDAHAYVFCDRRVHALFDTAAAGAGFKVRYPLIWDKCAIGLGGGPWRSQHELIAFYEKGSRPGNSKGCADVLGAGRVNRGYPTEKPATLASQLLAQSSAPGELVLDPFCGSGNVGVAARQLGRRALLCDLDPAFAARRLRLTPTHP